MLHSFFNVAAAYALGTITIVTNKQTIVPRVQESRWKFSDIIVYKHFCLFGTQLREVYIRLLASRIHYITTDKSSNTVKLIVIHYLSSHFSNFLGIEVIPMTENDPHTY